MPFTLVPNVTSAVLRACALQPISTWFTKVDRQLLHVLLATLPRSPNTHRSTHDECVVSSLTTSPCYDVIAERRFTLSTQRCRVGASQVRGALSTRTLRMCTFANAHADTRRHTQTQDTQQTQTQTHVHDLQCTRGHTPWLKEAPALNMTVTVTCDCDL